MLFLSTHDTFIKTDQVLTQKLSSIHSKRINTIHIIYFEKKKFEFYNKKTAKVFYVFETMNISLHNC